MECPKLTMWAKAKIKLGKDIPIGDIVYYPTTVLNNSSLAGSHTLLRYFHWLQLYIQMSLNLNYKYSHWKIILAVHKVLN